MASRLVIADPSRVFRRSLRRLLESEAPHWDIVAETETGEETVDAARRLSPDVIVMERKLSGDDGLEVLERIRELKPGTRVVMISFDWTAHARQRTRIAGAADVIHKHEAADRLVDSLRQLTREARAD